MPRGRRKGKKIRWEDSLKVKQSRITLPRASGALAPGQFSVSYQIHCHYHTVLQTFSELRSGLAEVG